MAYPGYSRAIQLESGGSALIALQNYTPHSIRIQDNIVVLSSDYTPDVSPVELSSRERGDIFLFKKILLVDHRLDDTAAIEVIAKEMPSGMELVEGRRIGGHYLCITVVVADEAACLKSRIARSPWWVRWSFLLLWIWEGMLMKAKHACLAFSDTH